MAWRKDPVDPAGEQAASRKYRAVWVPLIVFLGALLLWHLYRWAQGIENSYHSLGYMALLLMNGPWFTSRWRALMLGLGTLMLVSVELWLWLR